MIFCKKQFQFEKKKHFDKKTTSRKRYTVEETARILIFNDD